LPIAADARVVAIYESDGYAVAYVVTNATNPLGDIIVVMRRRGDRWFEVSSGSAGWTWITVGDHDQDGEEGAAHEVTGGELLGVLALVGELDRPQPLRVRLDDRVVEYSGSEPYWAAVFVGVDGDAAGRVVVELPRTEYS
jgi:hypothetical protein